jgi:glycerophosphoryl diester phosphodiesterase
MINIITHRGLDPDIKDFPGESTIDAFTNHLQRGYGIEFDVNFSFDERMFIFHDSGLTRITNGNDDRYFEELKLDEIRVLRLRNNLLPTFDELFNLIRNIGRESVNALHLKSKFQDKRHLEILTKNLKYYQDIFDSLIVFDVKIETARFLKSSFPDLNLAPSVAHEFDIQRYNKSVGGTLYSIEEVLADKDLFSWVWLDEWDLTDQNGGTKKLCTEEIFDKFRRAGIKTALVTPELHGTSPGLLGGESHPDAADMSKLQKRIIEIKSLQPDAICTDHPDLVLSL